MSKRTGNIPRPTLHDVARAAGVSVTTASNAINGKFALMSANTRLKVEAAIRALNYRVNAVGRSLRSAENKVVAFVALDDDPSFLRDPFTAETVAGFANAVSAEGFNTIIHRVDPARIAEHALFSTDDVAGLCMSLQSWARERHRAVAQFAALRLPIVLIENQPPKDSTDICAVLQDDVGGGTMLAQHVRSRGCRKVLMVRQAVDWTSIEDRDAGIAAVFANGDPDLSLDRLMIDHLSIMSDADRQLGDYIGRAGRPDALMAANDQIAAACMKTLARLGVDVPGDVAVTGFNGFDVFDLLPYRITTVRSAAYDLGRRGGEELAHRLRHGVFRAAQVTLPVSLRFGDTA